MNSCRFSAFSIVSYTYKFEKAFIPALKHNQKSICTCSAREDCIFVRERSYNTYVYVLLVICAYTILIRECHLPVLTNTKILTRCRSILFNTFKSEYGYTMASKEPHIRFKLR